jgi:cysteine synthase A
MVDWAGRRHVADTILEAGGLTPMVRLRRVSAGVSSAILVKLEYFSPSGSVKDRILPSLVSAAEHSGELKRGMTIIEGTTGNTGIATALVAAVRGYPAVIVMPEGMSLERKKTILAYGAELVLTPGGESDVDLVMTKVIEMKAAAPGKYWEVSQFNNPNNPEAHYRTTGPEIWDQTDGRIRAFVAAQGTGGTVTGVSRYLKERDAEVRVFAVEPAECDIIAGGSWGAHKIEGIGDGFVPKVLDLQLMDGVITVGSDEAILMARRLATQEGIFCGISSGCNVVAAMKLANAHPELDTIVTLVNDNGLRYLSTELCGEVTEIEVPDRAHDLDAESLQKLAASRLEVIR